MRPAVEKKMSLEEYVDFCISGKSIDFTIPFLNQIIHMHGFRKLHKSQKKTVGEAVDALDLLDLSRSTLKQGAVSSSASLTLDEVITDIEALKWQECCLTSLEVINSEKVTESVAKPKQKPKKRKKPTMKKLLNFDDEEDNTTILELQRKMGNKKKKKTKNVTRKVSEISANEKLVAS